MSEIGKAQYRRDADKYTAGSSHTARLKRLENFALFMEDARDDEQIEAVARSSSEGREYSERVMEVGTNAIVEAGRGGKAKWDEKDGSEGNLAIHADASHEKERLRDRRRQQWIHRREQEQQERSTESALLRFPEPTQAVNTSAPLLQHPTTNHQLVKSYAQVSTANGIFHSKHDINPGVISAIVRTSADLSTVRPRDRETREQHMQHFQHKEFLQCERLRSNRAWGSSAQAARVTNPMSVVAPPGTSGVFSREGLMFSNLQAPRVAFAESTVAARLHMSPRARTEFKQFSNNTFANNGPRFESTRSPPEIVQTTPTGVDHVPVHSMSESQQHHDAFQDSASQDLSLYRIDPFCTILRAMRPR
jgi:hypothetical protein